MSFIFEPKSNSKATKTEIADNAKKAVLTIPVINQPEPIQIYSHPSKPTIKKQREITYLRFFFLGRYKLIA
ncbi:hypothetical protein BAVI_05909 [Neobacillus vireti LMG 21834]|uniref:Uncharacterized protein n=1 Tax=Neobacillus vireti LMG 21834 TaxID=1131730 RepID=A0AB94IRY2_9BACI|nr:hypothetical protein BAVI_05909 [Neobacillus vireti LMG 21834]